MGTKHMLGMKNIVMRNFAAIEDPIKIAGSVLGVGSLFLPYEISRKASVPSFHK